MAGKNFIKVALLCAPVIASALELLPLPGIDADQIKSFDGDDTWDLESASKTIYIEGDLADLKDQDGLTLIPPSGYEFAEVFQKDLSQLTGFNWTLKRVDSLPDWSDADGAILLGDFTGDEDQATYENGNPTSEAYELEISADGIFIGGSGSRGMFWGTRTVLQLILVAQGQSESNKVELSSGKSVDAPAYATRGYMFDAGRKWYNKEFLMEMCSYASFFKMSEFHYHLSDNYPLSRGKNDTWEDVYSHFSLLPEDEDLIGIVHGRENETLSRDDYAEFQAHCASRGVAVIPEIEAPGHCLYVTKWKPELSLEKRDLLNLSHPETIPTIKRIWDEFLPWFDVKEVHVGADEYDAALADDYIGFVNEMREFVNKTSDKRIRIWGTPMEEPEEDIEIHEDIIIQHWQFGQSDPLELVELGHDLINSNDWWGYMGIKNDHTPIYPATYPQFFNESRIVNFAEEQGWQWTPADFNHVNTTDQVDDDEKHLYGAITAAWNDNGPDASTQLEMFYAMRTGIALIGARSWSGRRGSEVNPDTLLDTINYLAPRAPGQNLERVIHSKKGSDGSLVSWKRDEEDSKLGHGSKGLNWTLTLEVDGPFKLHSKDNNLTLDEDGTLVFNADGYEYPLRQVTSDDALDLDPGHPGRIWVNTTSSHDPVKVSTPSKVVISTALEYGSVAWIDGKLAGRFEVFIYGGKNLEFSWSEMAFVAPLESVEGKGLKTLKLEDGWKVPGNGNGDEGENGEGGDGDNGSAPPPGSSAITLSASWSMLVAVTMLTMGAMYA
jgi:hexosaminidase